jgi:hypothetical protein
MYAGWKQELIDSLLIHERLSISNNRESMGDKDT